MLRILTTPALTLALLLGGVRVALRPGIRQVITSNGSSATTR